MKVNDSLLENLSDIAEEAGRAIMDVYGTDCVLSQKADASPLTEADLRADRIIRARLSKDYPEIFVLSEESTSSDECSFPTRASDYLFLVDPLDGTKEFIKRNGEFTVNIALVYQGRVIAGVVVAPALGQRYFAAVGLGAWMCSNGEVRELQVRKRMHGETLRVIGSRSHAAEALDVWLRQLSCEHTFVAAGSSLKFCRVAEGKADVYPRFAPTSQWDTAAAQCILEVAGGAVLDLAGSTLTYGLERPILNDHFFAHGCDSVCSLMLAPNSRQGG